MDKTTLLTVLIGVMVLVALFQTVQIMSLSNAVDNGNTATALASVKTVSPRAPTTSPAASNSSGSTTTDISSLPSMVGGC